VRAYVALLEGRSGAAGSTCAAGFLVRWATCFANNGDSGRCRRNIRDGRARGPPPDSTCHTSVARMAIGKAVGWEPEIAWRENASGHVGGLAHPRFCGGTVRPTRRVVVVTAPVVHRQSLVRGARGGDPACEPWCTTMRKALSAASVMWTGGTLDAIEIVAADVRDPYAMRSLVRGAHTFHLAALIGIPYSYVAPASYVETNIGGTLNLLEATRRRGGAPGRHVHERDVWTAQYTPIDEVHPAGGAVSLRATKVGADQLALSYYRSSIRQCACVRPFNTFGPRQSERAIIPHNCVAGPA